LKVYAGLARVQYGGQTIEVSSGRMLDLSGGTASVQKFDREENDALDRWNARRGELLAMANASSAREVYQGARGNNDPCYHGAAQTSYVSQVPCAGGWRYNRWYGMWTYIPLMGSWCDPLYGYCYYNPSRAWEQYYRPPPVYVGGGGGPGLSTPGYRVSQPTSGGSSGTVASSNASVSSPSAGSGASAASSSAESSVGRGSAATGGHGR
jgi:hypothetical protein